MKRRRIALALAATAMVALTLVVISLAMPAVAVASDDIATISDSTASAVADPTWPPRPVRCPKQHVCVTWTYPQANGTACFMTPFTARNHTGRPCK